MVLYLNEQYVSLPFDPQKALSNETTEPRFSPVSPVDLGSADISESALIFDL